MVRDSFHGDLLGVAGDACGNASCSPRVDSTLWRKRMVLGCFPRGSGIKQITPHFPFLTYNGWGTIRKPTMTVVAIAQSAFMPSFRADHGLPRLTRRISVGQHLQHVTSHTHGRRREFDRADKLSPFPSHTAPSSWCVIGRVMPRVVPVVLVPDSPIKICPCFQLGFGLGLAPGEPCAISPSFD